ncbi:MAG: hypothetical protein AAGE52_05170 [Myxococcota bacterium]
MRIVLATLALAACGGSAPPPEAPQAEVEGPEVTVSLRLIEGEPSEADVPRTEASLALIHAEGRREVEPLGTLHGVCHHEAPDENALLQANCWWAGAGTVLRVVHEGDALRVVRVEIDEVTGPGNPQPVSELALPAGARLRPIR